MTEEKSPGWKFWESVLHSPRYIVAPMVDQSELPWRMLSRKYGAELCYTPMIHASMFVRDVNYRKEAIITCDEDRPLIVQFCANDPKTLLQAAQLVETRCDAIDLNLGCPQSIAKKGRYGAFLQDEWDLLAKMVNLCAEQLKIPITCKIRVYESIQKTVRYAQMLEKAGCQILTVHGRTREQKGRVTGVANWAHIKAVRENVNIPVFANGNIQYLSDVKRCMKETGTQGVMTAEGSLTNPAIFHGISPAIWEIGEEYLQMVEKYPCPISYIRGHIFKMSRHALEIHTDLREDVAKGKSIECFRLSLIRLKEKCLSDMEKYHNDPDGFRSELPLPYWLCQPYVRPDPTKERTNQSRLKRPLEDSGNINPEELGLSKNQLKKRLRYPHKNFDPAEKIEYERCSLCNNTKGQRCTYSLCKVCCRKKSKEEILDCTGHNFIYKTKRDGQVAWEEKVKELERREKSELRIGVSDSIIEPSVVVSDSIIEPSVVVSDSIIEPSVGVSDSIIEPSVGVSDSIIEPSVVVSDSIVDN